MGSTARYLVQELAVRLFGPLFPWGTLAVNLVGSFALGAAMFAALATPPWPTSLRLAIAAGVLGGFTTYSSFNYETVALMQGGENGLAAVYLFATVGGCLLAGFLGHLAARALVS